MNPPFGIRAVSVTESFGGIRIRPFSRFPTMGQNNQTMPPMPESGIPMDDYKGAVGGAEGFWQITDGDNPESVASSDTSSISSHSSFSSFWSSLKFGSGDRPESEASSARGSRTLHSFLTMSDHEGTEEGTQICPIDRLLWMDILMFKKKIFKRQAVEKLTNLVSDGANPFATYRGTTPLTLFFEQSARYQKKSFLPLVSAFIEEAFKGRLLNDVIKSVPNVILEENSSHISSIKEIVVKKCLAMIDEDPALCDHQDNEGKTPLHLLLERLCVDNAWKRMQRLADGTDKLFKLIYALITTTNVYIKDQNNMSPSSWLSWLKEVVISQGEQVSENLSRQINSITDRISRLAYNREKHEMKNVLRLKNSFCGIGIENYNVEKISTFIERGQNPRKVHKAEIEKLTLLQEYPIYEGYFAVISSQSLKHHNFCVYLMSVLRRLAFSTPNNKSTFVLVVVDKDAVSLLDDAQDKTIHWPIDLQAIPSVDACSPIDNGILDRILSKLQGPPLNHGVSQSVGNVGIGLAWHIFQVLFAFVLPGITERIAKSEACKKYAGKMSKHYIIIIPESYEIALEIKKKGIPRSKRIGDLDGGIKIERDGRASYDLKEVVWEITNSQGNCYYCSNKYISVHDTLNYMLESGELTEDEVKEQYSLCTDTIKKILCEPIYHNHALVLNCTDYSTLPDDLCDLITKQNKQPPLRIDTNPRNQVARVAEGLAWSFYRWYLQDVAPGLEEAMKDTKFYRQKEMPAKYFILMPYSCVIHLYINCAENESIKNIGKLDKHEYEIPIYKISAGPETYYACARYCNRLQVLHEMETGEIDALTPVQRAAELRIFYEVLNYLFTRPYAPEYCRLFKLVYYDDDKQTGRKLSEVLMDDIKESLREEQ